jgi:flavin reductase (DIM6/NTAB) family NADH-FMN oxidoreductase RutF
MKIEIGETKPKHYREYWPGQYQYFSHFEYISGIPSALFMITTIKENGKPNACFHAWSAFSGDSGGFFVIMPGLGIHKHTYKNILRDKEFCVNFLTSDYYDSCLKTIQHNSDEDDELTTGGFTAEPAKLVKPPRIREAFLTYECTLESYSDLSGKGLTAMIIGRVRLSAVDENHRDVASFCNKNGFMFNIHSPKDAKTGEGDQSAVATLQVARLINE